MNRNVNDELTRDEYTEYIFGKTVFGNPINPESAEDMIEGINQAIELEQHPVFLEGVSERLTHLGVKCSVDDAEIMLSEIKKRYKSILGKSCPRTVQEWIKGTTPGITNRINN